MPWWQHLAYLALRRGASACRWKPWIWEAMLWKAPCPACGATCRQDVFTDGCHCMVWLCCAMRDSSLQISCLSLSLPHHSLFQQLKTFHARQRCPRQLVVDMGGLCNSLPLSFAWLHLLGSEQSKEIGLQELQELSLADNILNGSLPSAWSSLSKLEYAVLESNSFTGSVPATWIQWSQVGKSVSLLMLPPAI